MRKVDWLKFPLEGIVASPLAARLMESSKDFKLIAILYFR